MRLLNRAIASPIAVPGIFLPKPALTIVALGAVAVLAASQPASGQTCVPPPSGMVGWWPGDGSAADIQDGNNGTLFGGATFAGGKVGQAFSFDGVDDFVEIPDSGNLDGASFTGLTLDAWVSPDDVTGGGQGIVTKYDTSGDANLTFSYYLGLNGNEITVGVGEGSSNYAFTKTVGAAVQPGVFTHVACTWDGVSFKVYKNGVEQAVEPITIQGAFPTSIRDSNVPVNIGSFESDVNGNRFGFFDGLIDEVEIFDRALSAGEVQAIFDAGSAGKCKVDCNGNGISDAQDIAGGTSQDCNSNGIPDECEILVVGRLDGTIGDFVDGIVVDAQNDLAITVVTTSVLDAAFFSQIDVFVFANAVGAVTHDMGPVARNNLRNFVQAGGHAYLGLHLIADGPDIAALFGFTEADVSCPDLTTGTITDPNHAITTGPFQPAQAFTMNCFARFNGSPPAGGSFIGTTSHGNAVAYLEAGAIAPGSGKVVIFADESPLFAAAEHAKQLFKNMLRDFGAALDCNGNGVPDECDIAGGTSQDCDRNSIPDECEVGTDTPHVRSINPRGAYVHRNNDPDAVDAVPVDLAAVGIQPGDFVRLTELGDFQDAVVSTDTKMQMTGVFSTSSVLAPAADLHRVVGAIDAGSEVFTSDTFFGGEPTDIPEDFLISNTIIRVPVGAAFLFVATSDSHSGDNSDPDGDYGLEITRLLYNDCNSNGIRDDCDIADGTSQDCNTNDIPDDCELLNNDCNSNETPDECELAGNDCNANGIPDECDIADGTNQDCNSNGIPDDCELLNNDCNSNGTPDECELAGNDCNANGIPDVCDITGSTSGDCDSDGVPDECQAALALEACPGNVTVQATDAAGIVVDYPTPSASGGCDPIVTVDPPSGTLFPIGSTTVTVTATDQTGATLTCTFDVTVTAPSVGAPQQTPQDTPPFCILFLFQSFFGIPLCGPCFLVGLIGTGAGMVGMKLQMRRGRSRRRRTGRGRR